MNDIRWSKHLAGCKVVQIKGEVRISKHDNHYVTITDMIKQKEDSSNFFKWQPFWYSATRKRGI